MVSESFDSIQEYLQKLDRFTITQLRFKSAEDVWSIGQLYMHLIEAANEYIDHVATCAEEPI